MKLAELARVLGATLEGTGPDVEITGVAPLEEAGPGTITVLADRRLETHLAATRASAVLLGPDAPPSPVPVLRVPHPWVAFARAMELFHPRAATASRHPSHGGGGGERGDRTRRVRRSLRRARRRGPDRARRGPAPAGHGLPRRAHRRSTSRRTREPWCARTCVIGDRVTLHAGAVIGSDGFGFVPLPDGHRKIPQVGHGRSSRTTSRSAPTRRSTGRRSARPGSAAAPRSTTW